MLKLQQEVLLVIHSYYWLVGNLKQLYQTFHYSPLSRRNNNNAIMQYNTIKNNLYDNGAPIGYNIKIFRASFLGHILRAI